MLGTIGQVTGIFGTIYYENYLKNIEVRTVLFWSTIISCFSALCQYAFALRWNLYLGINDMVFIICTDTIFGVISLAILDGSSYALAYLNIEEQDPQIQDLVNVNPGDMNGDCPLEKF